MTSISSERKAGSGIAASAASLVMVAGKRVTLHRDTLVIIHDLAALAYGTGPQQRKWAGDLDKIGAVYLARPAVALALHLCDEIEGGEAGPEAVARFDYTAFRNAPAQLVHLARQNDWATASPASGKPKGKEHA